MFGTQGGSCLHDSIAWPFLGSFLLPLATSYAKSVDLIVKYGDETSPIMHRVQDHHIVFPSVEPKYGRRSMPQ
jgi:hypothetical protein